MSKQESDGALQEKNTIITYFQPLVSLREEKMIAVEALSRGIHPETGDILDPLPLFKKAREENRIAEFDHICRLKAIDTFSKIPDSKNYCLLIKLDSVALYSELGKRGKFHEVISKYNIEPEKIIIEIDEKTIYDDKDLERFAETVRDQGYMILMDSIDSDERQMQRLIKIQPEFIKINTEKTKKIHGDFIKQSMVKSICTIAQQLGAFCIACSIESMQDFEICHQLGIDLFQGFLFGKPEPDFTFLEEKTARDLSDNLLLLNDHISEYIEKQVELKWLYERSASEILEKAIDIKPETIQEHFKILLEDHTEIEGIYIIDEDGYQVTDTISSQWILRSRPNNLYHGGGIRTNHSLKPYFYFIKYMKIPRYFTEMYLSPLTGNMCRTMAISLMHPSYPNSILCIDFAV